MSDSASAVPACARAVDAGRRTAKGIRAGCPDPFAGWRPAPRSACRRVRGAWNQPSSRHRRSPARSLRRRMWWQESVVYQIYPRSFADASGDGIGDLEGFRGRLDPLRWLAAAALWLSPIYPSPMPGFGSDVAEYCDIDLLFGDL